MKRAIIITAILSALSIASVASERNYDLRESETYCGRYSENVERTCPSTSRNVNTIAATKPDILAKKEGSAPTSFDRMMILSNENDHGRH
jgi:hypothetical protein